VDKYRNGSRRIYISDLFLCSL